MKRGNNWRKQREKKGKRKYGTEFMLGILYICRFTYVSGLHCRVDKAILEMKWSYQQSSVWVIFEK